LGLEDDIRMHPQELRYNSKGKDLTLSPGVDYGSPQWQSPYTSREQFIWTHDDHDL